jgi:tetratricopeptide (TPR) repeat protein
MNLPAKSRLVFLVAFALLAGTVALYRPVLDSVFINYDDNKYVTDNPHVQAGLTWASVHWALTSNYAANWHPLTWISHMADCEVFGLNPHGHHFTSLLLHAVNSFVLFGLLMRMTGTLWRSAAVAALFAWHPLHVESVAWIAERKDVLSTFFFLLTLWAYAEYVRRRGNGGLEKARGQRSEVRGQKPEVRDQRSEVRGQKSEIRNQRSEVPSSIIHHPSSRFYVLALVLFALGLMSKPMLVTLPCVLLLLDYWPLRRFEGLFNKSKLKAFLPLLWEKLPFFGLAAVESVITMLAQKRGGSVVPLAAFTFDLRCLNALASYLLYVAKLVWPAHLAVIYPFHEEGLAASSAAGGVFLLSGTLVAVRFRKETPHVLTGWFWFVGTLVPVIGLVQVGEQAMADRYSYIPSIGFFVAICWSASELLKPWIFRKALLWTAAAALLAACIILTRQQLHYWRDSISLFEHAIAVTEKNSTAHATLGSALQTTNRVAEAVHHYELALEFCPVHALAHNNYGVILGRQGRFEDAVAHYEAALAAAPGSAEAHFNLANALNPSYVDPHAASSAAQNRRVDANQAREHYQAALRLDPERVDALVNWGNLELGQGRYDAARGHYEEALRVDPGSWLARFNFGNLLSTLGKTNEAIASFRQAAMRRPDDTETQVRLANLLIGTSQFEQAIDHLQRAVKLGRDDWSIHNNLCTALVRLGRMDEATRHVTEYLAHHPDNPAAHASLGKLFALQGDPEQAIAQYSEVVRLEPENAEGHHQLALLFERQGKRDEAVRQFTANAELKPQDAGAHYDLAVALVKAGETGAAVAQFRKALKLKPDWIPALNNLAWLLATDPSAELRSGGEAVELARRACELTGYKDALVLGTLDAALAEGGQFQEAIETAQKTCALAETAGNQKLANNARARLELYRAGKPYHERAAGGTTE